MPRPPHTPRPRRTHHTAQAAPHTAPITRRRFIQSAAATLAFPMFIPGLMSRLRGANERLNIAIIGTRNRGWDNVQGVRSENLVALCDVDATYLGQAAEALPQAELFRDYRIMLDRMGDRLDAVVVSTADHCHGPASAMAMKLGKHVYCEKPLTHTVEEARLLATLAREKNLITQMGTQIHAESNYRRVVELIQSGAIGPVKEVHVWCGKSWSGGRKKTALPDGRQPISPAHFEWDLWLGPAASQPYLDNVHPAEWRRFWEFGTGTLGDMACHYVDLVHWALDLTTPTRIEAHGPAPHFVGTPEWMIVHWDHPAKNGRPAVRVSWYDGGKRPDILATLKRKDGSAVQWGDGHLFVGEKGMILSDYSNYLLLPEESFEGFTPPPQTIPPSIGHHREWVEACKTGGATTCNFTYSGALTETVLLGNVAFRAGEVIEWDPQSLRATNTDKAERFVRKEYRPGWGIE